MKLALKLMRVAEQALIDADRRMKPSMNADAVNVPLHRSAECLVFAIAAAEEHIAGRIAKRPAVQAQWQD